jgi:hypothetical protein
VTWFRLGCVGVLLALLGCGKVGERESGETHFVKCEVTSDCAALGSNYLCQSGECRPTTSAPEPDGPDQVEPEFPCSSGCPGGSCAIQGGCGLQTTCSLVECGSAAVDAEGCYRPSCVSDDDCDAGSRCTATTSMTRIDCVDDGPLSTCDCVNGKGLFDIDVCSPVELAGQRGAWSLLMIAEAQVNAKSSGYMIMENGGIRVIPKTGERYDAVLSAEDLQTLTRLIQGPDVRRLLASDAACPPVEAAEITMTLELYDVYPESYQPLIEKVVTGCVTVPGPLKDLLDLAKRY